jgi:ATP-dependent DNA ligase
LRKRRAALDAIAAQFPEYVRLPELLPDEIQMARLVAGLEEHSLEGIVVKRKESMYLEGKEPAHGSNTDCTRSASSSSAAA